MTKSISGQRERHRHRAGILRDWQHPAPGYSCITVCWTEDHELPRKIYVLEQARIERASWSWVSTLAAEMLCWSHSAGQT